MRPRRGPRMPPITGTSAARGFREFEAHGFRRALSPSPQRQLYSLDPTPYVALAKTWATSPKSMIGFGARFIAASEARAPRRAARLRLAESPPLPASGGREKAPRFLTRSQAGERAMAGGYSVPRGT